MIVTILYWEVRFTASMTCGLVIFYNKIILMHFFPNLYCTKKAKRAISFSNPLTGTFYSNQDFLKNCITVPRSISYLDHMK